MLAADAPRRPSRVPRVPDAAYRARRGDRAVLFAYDRRRDVVRDVACATSAAAYLAYWRALEVEDDDGIEELRRDGRLVDVAHGTGVLVLEVEEYPDDPRADCAVVRVADGPRKGEKLWTARHNVARMVANPDYRPPAAAKGKAADDAAEARIKAYYDLPAEQRRAIEDGARRQRAESDLVAAENLRKSGKAEQARKYYEKIVREYADLPEAKTARERLKVKAP